MQSLSSPVTTPGGAADSSSYLNSHFSSTSLTTPSSSRASSQLCDRCKLGWAPTFPTSLVPAHLDWFPTFRNSLNEALDGQNRKCSYTSVSVLLLSWSGDDIGVRDEIRELNDVFNNDFGFNTEYWPIPDLDAEDLLETRLLKFKIKRKDPTGLLIVYYGGHGRADRNTGELYWAATRQGSPSLSWSRLQAALFDRYKGDVFLILDCCHAAAAARPIRDDTKEVLAACAIESTTTSNGDFTFTKFLMRHLRLLLQKYRTERFSIFQLHASMCADKNLRISPVHAIVSGNRPIELAPQTLQGLSQHVIIPSISNLAIRDEKRVLVSIHLNGDHEQQYEAWKDWLAMSPPSGVSEVVIEGLYQGNSSLLLISLPTRAWAFLPDNPAIAFIGLVASDNIVYREVLNSMVLENTFEMSAPGRYPEAATMYRQTLALRQEVSGPEHPDTLASMNDLAEALSGQGKYAEAEAIYRQTLALIQKALGPDHSDTLTIMNDLAWALSDQGKYAEAEMMCQQTLAPSQKVLGPEHPDTLAIMNNLARTLSGQGKYAKAETICRQTLALRQKILGPEHLHTLAIMNNLARTLSGQEKYAEAETMSRQTLALVQKVSGPEHPYTLAIMNNLARTLSDQGKYAEAETIHRQTLAMRQQLLGPKHPDTLASINKLS